ncbi:MAG: hypothetical protein LW636_12490 [Planctomycetaceae bacterium]|nr:hypothetical protein [Planctomycetaceae bacterium]
MRSQMQLFLGLALAAVGAVGSPLHAQDAAPRDTASPAKQQVVGMPALPATPAAPIELVEVVPFELATPYEHNLRRDRHEVEPVLVAGRSTVERVNIGMATGLTVAIVPEWRERGADGVERAGDLRASRVFFASPELPERVDAAWIEAETRKAEAAGVPAAPRLAKGAVQELRRFADRDALNRYLADLVERHAPDEAETAQALRGQP